MTAKKPNKDGQKTTWRITFEVPWNWKKPVKSKLAMMGISIKDYMTTQVEKLSS